MLFRSLALKEKGYSRLYSAADGTLRIDDVMADSEGDSFPEGLMLMVDRVKIDGEMDADLRTRLLSSISACFSEGLGKMYVVRDAGARPEMREFNNRFEADGMTFREPDEYMFSFNSPLGACPVCGGLGKVIGISEDLVIPDKALSIYDGAIACWRGEKMGWFREHLINVAGRYGIPVFEPYCNLSDEVKSMIWEGRKAETEEDSLIGLNEFFKWVESNKYKIQYKYLLSRFSGRTVCGECKGSRLRKDALYVKVGGKNIHELLKMTAGELLDFFRTLELTEYETSIVRKAVDEVVSRLQYVADVGLSYLTLDRACSTLSGGESQRISLEIGRAHV